MKPESYSILPLPASDECVARVEPPTSSHYKKHYLAALNNGLDYLAGSILCLWIRAFPEDFEDDVETDEGEPRVPGQAYTEAGNECMSAWERNQ